MNYIYYRLLNFNFQWTEETWASSAGTNERAYVTCSYSEANPINWLFTPVVQTRKANL